ncbi:uncharacterized protein SPPG_09179 [Spizellomyces punctatus DAOM BR117]|uniref:Zn(2)-C6 fungal-type domain-containing protein n=1 Tax=Spizellomyces punctatus (strain DAOM BR117) TaxID=645134 RepID=A0A0L0HJA0_SPIPD|nr:uncharacterized protein SPPG_09179 [Spizellomyces punctatus DAOM BR117]KND01088.1 hypothetical protein SPPG_09179 [Spizellomyces punctatus DAOM BR117]|eukprot:XP_016609127.1 hypothetical protein SPPG_09179 [Spizellomyces punctatus DAOM BR117]
MVDTPADPPKSKRKKASRACGHCQKAHLTCDDMRPCSRCVKRDLAATCADGVRKKAKYLQDVDDSVAQTSTPSPAPPANTQQSAQDTSATTLPNNVDSSLLGFPLAPNFNFGSKTVNLEYSFLSNMLGAPPIGEANGNASPFPLGDMGMGPQMDLNGLDSNQNDGGDDPGGVGQRESMATTNSPVTGSDDLYADSRTSGVYKNVLRPYDYREGFHSLVRHVKERMEKNDIMRICRALAQFRPSFMAQIMNLSEEDLVFMEKCFQRTILEFDKLIGSSGTPTVVWRRTGEIALVGKEFSILTQWPREQLLGKKSYIYELMDNSSAVEYWEKFSLIAFDNSQQSVMTTSTLLSPSGRPVPCAFCFTIKRDIFDVPLAIVGNFLPLFRPV